MEKEEALKIYNKFLNIIDGSKGKLVKNIHHNMAKECALLHAKLVMDEFIIYDDEEYKWWNNVREELKLL